MNLRAIPFLLFLCSCAVGGFDVTQPLIKLQPERVESHTEEIKWQPYQFGLEVALADTDFGCSFFYFTMPVGCAECDQMNKTLAHPTVVTMLNKHFLSFKVTSDSQDWERAIDRFETKDPPGAYFLYYNRADSKYVSDVIGVQSPSEFVGTLTDIVDRYCYDPRY